MKLTNTKHTTMKKTKHLLNALVFGLLLILQSFTIQGDSKIKYNEESWSKVTKQATDENKLIFVYVSMKGCHTCNDIEKSLANSEVSEFFNANFINVHLDGTKTANNMRASKWGVAQVPAIVFLNGKSKVIHKLEGYQSAEDMIAQAKLAIRKKDQDFK